MKKYTGLNLGATFALKGKMYWLQNKPVMCNLLLSFLRKMLPFTSQVTSATGYFWDTIKQKKRQGQNEINLRRYPVLY